MILFRFQIITASCERSLSQTRRAFLKKICYFCCTFENLTKNILFDCFGVKFVPHFRKMPNFQNDQQSR